MIAATFVTAGAAFSGAAFAETGGAGGSTSGSASVLGGNQVSVPVSVPVNACGNAAAVLGDSAAGCEGTAAVHQTLTSAVRPEGTLAGSPKAAPMRRQSAVQPAADPLIPGLTALPVMSALEELSSQAASTGPALQSALPGGPGGVYLPRAPRVPRTGRLPLGTRREVAGRGLAVHGKKTVSRWPRGRGAAARHWAGNAVAARCAASNAASRGLAILGAFPVVTGTPGPANGAAPASLSALASGSTAVGETVPTSMLTVGRTAVGKALPASTVTAGSVSGMGAASFYSLAIGALMAGAVALKMAGRRTQGRKA
jgi:hypothetical protein